ncbi:4-(cytidine 5'-diphospho)-2-C-methyl-D-erythritol kinase [Aciduricibacillus chroicocephali]|uniref:4-diphosphocytidyl-2-C-methyl-D-erythritol kinase n=1 Tax=Aciduricibacillus chroicocephali TaxID=3054939 RepID=A0ABY9KWP8_9BACI|nr:4-(cytidine 5'-diphospho)-2-C-methyl-D-erythritol kinase [Bacillaceae bacterium 44XB]
MVLYEKAPAKVNLLLDVLGKRTDGYHEVAMVMTTVDLFDRLEFHELKEDRIEVLLESRFVPSDERNLAYKAAAALKKKYGIKEGIQIKIEKSIPVSAGLGGGSSDAAAVLRGLNRLWSLNLSNDELADLGAGIGSDIPFCVHGRTALATGRGEKIQELPSPPPCWVVLAKLDIGVSSRTVFENLELDGIPHPNLERMLKAIEDKDFAGVCANLGNVLECVTLDLHPDVATLRKRMEQLGATGVLMSGSGPTIYGLVSQEAKAHRLYNGLRGFCDEVHVVRMLG